ncbi:MAG TPA: peptidoglycan DD-metalloendopeptidase family protein [Longimicrobiales bacterium]|nr:peptidoglycan DD-metalloendopeptidase family protein [Longimicrobiales bacterium]
MASARALPRVGILLSSGLLLAWGGPGGAEAQQDLRAEILESQRRLEEIRAERARLESEIGDVRNRVRDVSQELANVERRLSATLAVLAEVDFQTEATSAQVRETTSELIRAQDRLAESQAVLHRRLRDIYKLGPLHTVEVLLGARSLADLLNRYKYLQQIASWDRQLVERVRALQSELRERNDELRERMTQLGVLRQQRVSEVAELRAVESERERALREFRTREERAVDRLTELEQDETRMTALIDDLEARRRALEAERARAGGATLRTSDAGLLDWPVDGDVIYEFGRDQRPNGTVLRWNGIGLAAPPGTPVRAVRSGRVVLAGPFEGYGPTVVLSHGDGFYTLYLYLEEIGVVEGREVEAGQVVGTVGGADTPEGPHIEFQIRAPVEGGSPRAQDPLEWLKPREAS